MAKKKRRSKSQPAWAGLTLCAFVLAGASVAWSQTPDTIRVQDGFGLPGHEVVLPVLLNNEAVCSGWSAGVCHDSSQLELLDVTDGQTTAALSGGDGPDFHQVNLYADGFTSGVVISFLGGESLPPGGDQLELHVPRYQILDLSSPALVEFCDTLGQPRVSTVIVHEGASVIPIQVAATVRLGAWFRRADVNTDGGVDLADVIFLEQYLFSGGADPACLAAADVNDDSLFNLADGITLLSWLFSGGLPPEEPFSECGLDPTPSEHSCDSFPEPICP